MGSDKNSLLTACILQSDLDILGIGETHLTDGHVMSINNYTWFGNNRKHIHRRARTGSGWSWTPCT